MKRKFIIPFVIFGAFAGFILSGLLYHTGDKSKYVVYGIGFGGLAGFVIANVLILIAEAKALKNGRKLNALFVNMGNFAGKDINDVIAIVGPYKSKRPVNITDRNEKGYFYTFASGIYLIEILVGADGKCIRKEKEIFDGKSI